MSEEEEKHVKDPKMSEEEEKHAKVLKLMKIRQIFVTSQTVMQVKTVEDAMDYVAKDGDVVLSAYPKAGSTWLMYAVWEILHKGEPYHDVEDMYCKHSPFIELVGPDAVDAVTHPRFFKTHLPFYCLNINKNAKYVYIYRKPEDVLASFYSFSKFFSDENFDFDFFFEAFMCGHVWYGDYFDHVMSAYSHIDEGNVLLISYENLKQNTREEFLRIAKFLGEEYESALRDNNEDVLKKVLEVTSFDYMKDNLTMKVPLKDGKGGIKNEVVDFFRKGVTGEGKKYLNEEQRKRLRDKVTEKMKGADLFQSWLS